MEVERKDTWVSKASMEAFKAVDATRAAFGVFGESFPCMKT